MAPQRAQQVTAQPGRGVSDVSPENEKGVRIANRAGLMVPPLIAW